MFSWVICGTKRRPRNRSMKVGGFIRETWPELTRLAGFVTVNSCFGNVSWGYHMFCIRKKKKKEQAKEVWQLIYNSALEFSSDYEQNERLKRNDQWYHQYLLSTMIKFWSDDNAKSNFFFAQESVRDRPRNYFCHFRIPLPHHSLNWNFKPTKVNSVGDTDK